MIIVVRNDPERAHAGPDEATIGGMTYVRLEDEDRGQWHARLAAQDQAAGQSHIVVSLAGNKGKFLDDFPHQGPHLLVTRMVRSAEAKAAIATPPAVEGRRTASIQRRRRALGADIELHESVE
jgi:hypothetical protein